MPNIYTAIQALNALQNSSKLTLEQQTFARDRSVELKALTGSLNLKALHEIEKQIKDELTRTSYWDWKYRRGLHKALIGLDLKKFHSFLQSYKDACKKAIQASKSRPPGRSSGRLLLPIRQSLDFRMGKGQCAGYVRKWAKCWLNNQKPFGIDPYGAPIFKKIELNSPVLQQYPDLLHLAVVTEEISALQERHLQKNQKYLIPNVNTQVVSSYCLLYAERMTEQLITLADQYPKKIYEINLITRNSSGHAIGFAKDKDGKYHFLDPNNGWRRFKKVSDLKKWLPNFINVYYPNFHEYIILSHESNSSTIPPSSLTALALDKSCKNFRHYIIIPFYYYVIVTLCDLFRWVKNKVVTLFGMKNTLVKTSSSNKLKQEFEFRTTPPTLNSFDDFNIRRKTKEIRCINSTHGLIAGLLDVSLQDFTRAKKCAEINPYFPSSTRDEKYSDNDNNHIPIPMTNFAAFDRDSKENEEELLANYRR